jgi:glycosyltransferase involved in cell wall biosynthesis
MRVLVIAEGLDLPEQHVLMGVAGSCEFTELLLRDISTLSVELPDRSTRVTQIPMRGRYDPAAILAIRRRLAGGKFDIVHCLRNNRPICNTIAASVGLRPRIIAYRGTSGHLRRWNPASWASYLNPKVSRIVCVSDSVREYLLRQGVHAGKLVTIRKGHDVRWYAGREGPGLAAFGIPPGSFTIGCAANVRPCKGVDVLIRAFRRLPRDGTFHLLLAGEIRDPQVARMLREDAASGLIHAPGFLEDACRVMGLCNAFVMPSIEREGLPRAVVEAMAQGVPPIVTRVGGMPELVQDGVSGLVVPPNDDGAIARAVLAMAADPGRRDELARNAKLRTEGEFSVGHTIARTLALYRELTALCRSDCHSGQASDRRG